MRHHAARDHNELEITAMLRKLNVLVIPVSSPGLPDLLIGFDGKWAWIEVKNKTGKLTAAQDRFFFNARLHGLPCFIARSIDDIPAILTELNK